MAHVEVIELVTFIMMDSLCCISKTFSVSKMITFELCEAMNERLISFDGETFPSNHAPIFPLISCALFKF